MKIKKLRSIALLGFALATGTLHAQLALDLAGPGNYAQTTYSLNQYAFTIEYDMYMHTLQNYNGGVSFTCGGGIPAPIDFYVDQTGNSSITSGNCALFTSGNSSLPLAAGNWYTIAHVYGPSSGSGTQPLKTYINGMLVSTLSVEETLPQTAANSFRIGSRVGDVTNANAKFDNVRIWSTARTGSEVLADMTTCFTGNEFGLDILYNMEEGSGTTLYDLAGNNGTQNATIVGGVTWTTGVADPIAASMINISACDSYTSPSGNHTWSANGTYSDTLSAVAGCDSVITINLLINSIQSTPTISDANLCLGESTQLDMSQNSTSEFYIGDPNTPNYNTPGFFPSVYGNFFDGTKHQILVRASELTAMGMSAGDIDGMEFYVYDMYNSTDSLLGLTIKFAHTTASELTYLFETPNFVTTYSVPYYLFGIGAMSHDFSTPFTWDGTSNLLIETCYNNDVLQYTQNAGMLFTTTEFASSSYFYGDNNANLCSEQYGSDSFDRPNFKLFGNTSNDIMWTNATGGIANPTSASTSATPTASGTYLLDVSNGMSGCSNQTSVNVSVLPYPTVNLGADISQVNPPVTLDAGAGFTAYDWSSGQTTQTISVTSSGTYIATVTNANGCAGSDTILVEFTTGIENLDGSTAQIRLYPNPTSDFLNMELIGYTGELLTIELIDLNGKLVKSFEMKNIVENTKTQLDMNNVLNGVYLITITTPTSTSSHRIVVNH